MKVIESQLVYGKTVLKQYCISYVDQSVACALQTPLLWETSSRSETFRVHWPYLYCVNLIMIKIDVVFVSQTKMLKMLMVRI